MNVTDFTKGRIYCALQEMFLFFLGRGKIYRIYGITALVASTLFPAHNSFAQDPVLAGIEATALNYDEGDVPTQITGAITVSDADSPMLASATVQITGNYLSAEDLLQFNNAFSITGSYDALTGTLTLTGPASLANFTSALRSITYQNINNNHPSNLVRTVSFSVNDGVSNSIPVSRDIQVNRINDAPTGQPDSFVINEDTELDCGCLLLNDADPDGDDLTALVGQPPANGTITDLGGFFIYTPNPNFYGTDTFTYYANDGTTNSNDILVTVTVLPVNDAPIAVADGISTDEDNPIGIPILSNDTDVDDVLDASMIVVVNSPTQGTVVINTTTGTVVYTPNLNFNGNDSFTYQIKDASGALSNIVAVNIIVNPVNDAPIGNPDFVTTPEETPISIPVLANDTDVDNALDAASLIVVNDPANGSAVVQSTTGMILYTPQTNFTGNDTFTYQVKDASGTLSNIATVNITITPVNDPPVANPDFATTQEEMPISIPVLANDTDVDNALDASSLIVVSGPANGTAVVQSSGMILYTPQTNFTGNDSFTYQVKDAAGALSNIATVSIVVNPVNDAPIANPDFATTPEETPISIPVLANDTDVDNALDAASLIVVNAPANGSAVVQSTTGMILYTPQTNFTGNDSFTYQVKDVSGALSNIATVSITVSPVNDAPVANPDFATTQEEIAVSIPVLANDTDVDNALNASSLIVVSGPANGTAVVQSSGMILYTPQTNFTGNNSFTYRVKDAAGALSNIATVSITVNPVNDAPVANPDFATTPEETPISIPVLANDTDVDNALNVSSLIVVNGPANGSAAVQSTTGMILYTPQKDFTGTDSFTYTVKDMAGATSAPATVTVTVSPVNDPPVAVNDEATTEKNTPVDISILLNDYDVDNDLIATSVIITTNPIHGEVIFNASTGLASFTPETDFLGNDSFTYTIRDAAGLTSSPATVSVTVLEASNRAPHAVDDGPIVNSSLSPITIDVLANDYDEDNDHDELSLVSVTNPSMGAVSIVNGKIVYQSGGLTTGTVTFTYTIQDPSGLTDEAVVTIENFYPPLTVSEGFSPNNDSNNETWYILGIENYPTNSIKVFDRWGFLVYQKQHYENTTSPWDGRGNTAQQSGKLLDQGTYYYILEPGGELKTMTGYVVIVR